MSVSIIVDIALFLCLLSAKGIHKIVWPYFRDMRIDVIAMFCLQMK